MITARAQAPGRGRRWPPRPGRLALLSFVLVPLAAVAGLLHWSEPAVFHLVGAGAVAREAISAPREQWAEQRLSLLIALVLFATYLLHLVFSLRTHRHLYAGQQRAHEAAEAAVPAGRAALTLAFAT